MTRASRYHRSDSSSNRHWGILQNLNAQRWVGFFSTFLWRNSIQGLCSLFYSLTECMLDYESCQVNWFTLLCYKLLIKMITVQSLWHIKIWNKCMSQSLNQYPMVTNLNCQQISRTIPGTKFWPIADSRMTYSFLGYFYYYLVFVKDSVEHGLWEMSHKCEVWVLSAKGARVRQRRKRFCETKPIHFFTVRAFTHKSNAKPALEKRLIIIII